MSMKRCVLRRHRPASIREMEGAGVRWSGGLSSTHAHGNRLAAARSPIA
jgi:hypothetical protein